MQAERAMFIFLPPGALALAMVAMGMLSSVIGIYKTVPETAAYRIEKVPLADHHPNWCGPDALAAVLQFHGDSVTAKEIAEAIYLPHYHGSLNLDLLLYARQRGYEVHAESGTVVLLTAALRRDRPVICMLRKHSLLSSSNHYVIVRGFDAHAGVWYVDNGGGKEERIASRAFLSQWEGCDCWMLVVEGRTSAQATAVE